jgi:hypothetical protein
MNIPKLDFIYKILDHSSQGEKDSVVKIDLIQVAKKLNDSVDMSEHEFRLLLSKVFENVPSYHIKSIVRNVKKGNKLGKFESLSHRIRDVE